MFLPVLALKPSSQYDATHAMGGVKRIRVRRNRLGFNSCLSCVHALRRIVNRALRARLYYQEEVIQSSKGHNLAGCDWHSLTAWF